MMNLHTKVEVSMFTHYKDMEGNAKCRNWGVLCWLGVTQDYWQPNHLRDCIQLSIRL